MLLKVKRHARNNFTSLAESGSELTCAASVRMLSASSENFEMLSTDYEIGQASLW